MLDKTTVTNSLVSSESGDEQNEDQSRDSDARDQNPLKTDRPLENQTRELQRKLANVSDQLEKATDKIEALESKANLSRADRDKLERLEDEKSDLESIKRKILSNPQAEPWLKINEETSKKIASETADDRLYEYDYRQSLKLVKGTAKMLKQDPEKFESELFGILKGGRWEFDRKGNRILPTERVELAIEEWQKLNELSEKAKGKEVPQYAERGSNRSTERTQSTKTDLETAKKSGSFQDLLARKARAQSEFFK